jgi:hypothetical protein
MRSWGLLRRVSLQHYLAPGGSRHPRSQLVALTVACRAEDRVHGDTFARRAYRNVNCGWACQKAQTSAYEPHLSENRTPLDETIQRSTRSMTVSRCSLGSNLRKGPVMAVRPEGANHLWRKTPPRELSIDLVADGRLGRVTGRAGAS